MGESETYFSPPSEEKEENLGTWIPVYDKEGKLVRAIRIPYPLLDCPVDCLGCKKKPRMRQRRKKK